MTRFRIALCLALCGIALILLPFRGETTTFEDRVGPAASALPLYPGWIRHQTSEFGCGAAVNGKFTSADSAQSYSMEVRSGYRYTLNFSASYAPENGAAIVVFNANTKRRVAAAVKRASNQATLTFSPAPGKYLVSILSISPVSDSTYSLRQICELKAVNELTPGQTSFSNLEPKYIPYPYPRPVPGKGVPTDNAGKPAPPPAAPAPQPESPRVPEADAPGGRRADVEEADIYKIDSNRFFYLNTYKGFIIYDISNTKQPRQVSRLPIYGYPVEMFIQNNTVYALIQDALYLTQKEGSLVFEKHNVSQLVSIDVSDLRNPKVLQRVDILGQLREGVSRKVQDTIYVVSYQNRYYYWRGWGPESGQNQQNEQAWVYSFNVADPKQLKLVDKLKIFEGGGINNYTPGSSISRHFQSVALSATSNALMVVENWNVFQSVHGSPYSCGSSVSLQQAIVSIVNISDPAGKIRLHTRFETYGHLEDQFKQTYIFDEKTRKGTYLGIFARREWASVNCTGLSRLENNLESWDVSDGANPIRLDHISFGKPDETVRGSLFDSERKVAFAITARQIDPLYAISFENPSNLRIASEVDGLSGDMNVFRFIGNNRFLLAIGVDNSNSCTGFDTQGQFVMNVAASIIDVQDMNRIRLVERKCVVVENAAGVTSEVNWNRDQAHKMIGLHSDGMANVLSIPVHYTLKSNNNNWWFYRSETAVGLMSYDLTRYDPAKDEKSQTVLKTHGTIVHPAGSVRRTIVFTHKAEDARRKMLNISNTHYSISDIQNLEQPVRDSVVEVAPYHVRLTRFGNYVVEQVLVGSEGGWSPEMLSEFRIKPVNSDPESTELVGKFTVGQVERTIQFKDKMVVFRRNFPHLAKSEPVAGKRPAPQPLSNLEAIVFDLSDPARPFISGSVSLPPTFYVPYIRFSSGDSPQSLMDQTEQGAVVTNAGIAMLTYGPDKSGVYGHNIVILDLANPKAPAVTEYTLNRHSALTMLGLVPDAHENAFFLAYKVKVGEKQIDGTNFDEVKYNVQRWVHRGLAWNRNGITNLPGRLLKTYIQDGNKVLVCHDTAYEKRGSSLNGHKRMSIAVRLNQTTARLTDTYTFWDKNVSQLVISSSKLYVAANDYRPVYGPIYEDVVPVPAPGPVADTPVRAADVMPGKGLPVQPSTNSLMVFDLSEIAFNLGFTGSLGPDYFTILGAYRDRLFINLPGAGILVLNTESQRPSTHTFVPTVGYATEIEFADRYAYVIAGQYGVIKIDLEQAQTSGLSD